MRELLIPIQQHMEIPLYEQIYNYISSEIADGNISQGEKLPSTRLLARQLQISRSTVELAYEQLVAEGYVESIPCSGYYACDISELYQGMIRGEEETETVRDGGEDFEEHRYVYDFSPFQVDQKHFPVNTWSKLQKELAYWDSELFFLPCSSKGHQGLRKAIADYLHFARGVHCDDHQVVVGAGHEYLLLLLSQILGSNLVVGMEQYSYIRAAETFRNMEYMVAVLSMDGDGISIPDVRNYGIDIAYVMPSHQFPLGSVMPMRRRLELLQWADEQEGRYIIEDDHDSEFRYRGRPIPSLQSMAKKDEVIYLGTFSKSISPVLRVSYMVLPKKLLPVYEEKCSFYASTVSNVQQELLYRFMKSGEFEKHLNRMKKIYKAKQEYMMTLLKQESWVADVSGDNAGLHVMIRVASSYSEDEIVKLARDMDVKMYGLSRYCLGSGFASDRSPLGDGKNDNYFLMGYGNLEMEQMKEGILRLRKIFE